MSGLFDHKYPTTNLHELDLSWVLQKITEFGQRLDTFETDLHDKLLAETEAYVDQEMAGLRADFAQLVSDYTDFKTDVDLQLAAIRSDFSTFTNAVNIMLNLMSRRIDDFAAEIDAAIIGVNALTDLKIEQNNEYILEEVAKGIVNVKVLNYFTGEYVTVQAMFNYLSELHLENPITYTELAAAAIDYDALAALNMTYTELAVKGKSFINP
jgi:hypothetical protein